MGNSLIEKLLATAETTEEETHSHDKEEIGEDAGFLVVVAVRKWEGGLEGKGAG